MFSAGGVRSFYELAERDASKGLADYRMLLRKLPRELFDGRRTFAHDLFGAQDTESYLDALDLALAIEIDALGRRRARSTPSRSHAGWAIASGWRAGWAPTWRPHPGSTTSSPTWMPSTVPTRS